MFRSHASLTDLDLDLDYEEYEFQVTTMGTVGEVKEEDISTIRPSVTVTDPSIYSQLLWNSFLRKIDS